MTDHAATPRTSPAPSHALRPAVPSDLAAVERLLRDCGLPTAGVRDLFEEAAGDFLLAVDESGEPVAAAGLEVRGEHALLRSVAVRADRRGQGIGEELVGRLVADAERRGLRSLHLLTTTAERWFPRFGFETVSREEVPAELLASEELRSACPASATVMRRVRGATAPVASSSPSAR